MITVNNIADLAHQAICAIGAVQSLCTDADLNIAVYALDSARKNIDEVIQLIECGEFVSRQKVVDYAKDFEEYCDPSEKFSAEQFLMDFDEFESEGECNGG